jgi:ABC-type polysaccharide/polyol phosphate export permease
MTMPDGTEISRPAPETTDNAPPAKIGGANALRHRLNVISVLVARDHRARYKSTIMGMAWAVASPILFLLTFYFLFGVVMRVDIPNYASFAFAGIIAWTWLQTSLNEGVACISFNGSLVGQPGFPLETLPTVSVVSNLISLAFSMPLLFIVTLAEQGYLSWTAFLIPFILAVQFVFLISLVYFISAANVRFRDVQYMLPVVLQLGFFMTPIFYSVDQLPGLLGTILRLNPMSHIITAIRAAMAGEIPSPYGLMAVLALSLVLLFIGYRYFLRAAENFLEEI